MEESSQKKIAQRRSFNIINSNMNEIYHENLQHTYTDDITEYKKHVDESIATWNKTKTEKVQLIEAITKKDSRVIEADYNILSDEQRTVLHLLDKKIAAIINTSIENVQKKHEYLIERIEHLKEYRANAKESIEGVNSSITSIFE